jgi:hypothetical protein
MTLMDAPKFDAQASRRRALTIYGFIGGFVLLLLFAWLAVGHPLDAPWNWWTYWTGQRAAEKFLTKVEANDMQAAYGVWVHDSRWQDHKADFTGYPYDRFAAAFGPSSQENEYGTISSHKVVVAKIWGGNLVLGAMINGRKSKPLFLVYDRKAHTLGFSPVELTIGDQMPQ